MSYLAFIAIAVSLIAQAPSQPKEPPGRAGPAIPMQPGRRFPQSSEKRVCAIPLLNVLRSKQVPYMPTIPVPKNSFQSKDMVAVPAPSCDDVRR